MKYQGFLVYVIQCIMLSFQKPKIRAFHEDLYLQVGFNFDLFFP